MEFFVELFGFMTVPMILFMIIVAPIWITMHYRSRNKSAQGLSDMDREQLDQLLAQSETLSRRIETLESLLDQTHPHWSDDNSGGQ